MVFCPEENAASTPLWHSLKEFAEWHSLTFLGSRNLQDDGNSMDFVNRLWQRKQPPQPVGQRWDRLQNRRTHPVIGASTNNLVAMVALSSLQAKIVLGFEFSGPGKGKNYGKENELNKLKERRPWSKTSLRVLRTRRGERAVGGRFYTLAGASHQFAQRRGRGVADDGGIGTGNAPLPLPRGWRMARRPRMRSSRAESLRQRRHAAAGGVSAIAFV